MFFALTFHWAVWSTPNTIATRLNLVFLVDQFCIVFRHCLLHVGHALVGQLHRVSVEDFMKGVFRWKRRVLNSLKLFPYVCFHTEREWCIVILRDLFSLPCRRRLVFQFEIYIYSEYKLITKLKYRRRKN